MILGLIALLALTRAEIIERMKSPIVTQANGFVQVYADCPEDMRREFQSPIARFAADTVQILRAGARTSQERHKGAGIVIHIGDVRTNLVTVTARAVTNDTRVFTRIMVRAPAYADLERFRVEVIKAYFRATGAGEKSDAEALRAWRRANPEMRIEDERRALEDWICHGKGSDDEGFRLMRKIMKPGFASQRDVLIFASRLYLYPPYYDMRFSGGRDAISFRDAIGAAKDDLLVRIVALSRADMLPVFGGGRGERLTAAANAYRMFLLELAKNEKTEEELTDLLDEADILLNIAYEKSEPVKGPY